MTQLFPEIPKINLTIKHMRVLYQLYLHRQGIWQQELGTRLGLSSKDISLILTDWRRLGWIKETYVNRRKKVRIRKACYDDVRFFLAKYKLLKGSVLVKPHDILLIGSFLSVPSDLDAALEGLSYKFRIIICRIRNNKQYTIVTPYGKIIILSRSKNPIIQFTVDKFVIPVLKHDLDILEPYVWNVIVNRVSKMQSLLSSSIKEVKIHHYIDLSSMAFATVLLPETYKTLRLQQQIQWHKLFVDKSIPGCIEVEAEGKCDVIKRSIPALNEIFAQNEALSS